MSIERISAALSDNFQNRNAYTGKVTQHVKVSTFLEDGTPVEIDQEVYLSWETINKVLELVRNKAGLQ